MLNFRNTNIVFVIALAGIIGFDLAYHASWLVYLSLAVLYSLLIFYGSYFVGSNFFFPVICSAITNKKQIAITFDDGPDLAHTPEILDMLKAHDIHSTFFCIGNRIPGNEKLLKQIHDDGHIIGNHSFSHHFWFDLFGAQKMKKDLAMMDEAMAEVIGIKPRFFRPPYGVTTPNLEKAVRGTYIPIGWNIRSMDTVIRDEEKLLAKVTRSLKPGAIILFHDTSKTTLNILQSFIRHVKANGYEIVRLDKMLKLEPYA